MIWKVWLPALFLSYLLGAIPFSYLIARARGVDIRHVGSGNVGATNVFRAAGRPWGVLALLLDMLKGFVPSKVLPLWLVPPASGSGFDLLGLSCGLAAIAGHTWPVFLGFRGGKGVATGAGVLGAVAPMAAGIGVVVWVVAFGLGRFVSLASLLAALTAAASSWALYREPPHVLPMALTAIATLVLWRHRGNLSRLRAGTEPRAGFGARNRSPSS